MDLKGRHLVITGGASGIGHATARMGLSRGARVVIFDADPLTLQVADELGCKGVQVDITGEAAVNAAVAQAVACMGAVDGLVHAAGIAAGGALENTELQLWLKVISVNLTGTFIINRALLPWLRKAEGASVVNVASGQGIRPGPGTIAYASSKGGVVTFGKALAMELAPHVRVNTVCPGFVRTPMTEKALLRNPGGILTSSYALQRAADPDELAESILYLISSAASYVTGTTLTVDGGRCYL